MRKTIIAFVILAAILLLPKAQACIPDQTRHDCVIDYGEHLSDIDCDCEADEWDNCEFVFNPAIPVIGQPDADGDGIGDACEEANLPPRETDDLLVTLECTDSHKRIDLNTYVEDPEGLGLHFRVSSPSPSGIVQRESESYDNFVFLTALDDGDAHFSFDAFDGVNTASFTMAVEVLGCPVNQPPTIGDVPGQSIYDGDSFVDILMTRYVRDVDTPWEDLDITAVSSHGFSYDLQGEYVQVSYPAGFIGTDCVRFKVYDPLSGGSDIESSSEKTCFEVKARVPEDPYFRSIPRADLTCDDPDGSFELADYLQYQYPSKARYVLESVNPAGIAQVMVSSNGHVQMHSLGNTEVVTVKVAAVVDEFNQRAGGEFKVDVTGCETPNLPPRERIELLVTLQCTDSHKRIDLNTYVEDPDGLGLHFRVSSPSPSGIVQRESESYDNFVFLTALDEGDAHFSFDAFDGVNTVPFTMEVKVNACPVNQPPTIRDVPGKSIYSGDRFTDIPMSLYVSDVDSEWSDLFVSVVESNHLFEYRYTGEDVLVEYPPEFIGTDCVTFQVRDRLSGKTVKEPVRTCFEVKKTAEIPADPYFRSIPRVPLTCNTPDDSFELADYLNYQYPEKVRYSLKSAVPNRIADVTVSSSGNVQMHSLGNDGVVTVKVAAIVAEFNQAADGEFKIDVTGCEGNDAPVWHQFTIPQVPCGEYLDFTIESHMVDDTQTSFEDLRISAQSLDSDFTVQPRGDKTFRITHVSGETDQGRIRFTASDGLDSSNADRSVSASCGSTNHDPVFDDIPPLRLSCNGAGNFDLHASDNDGDTLTYSVGSASPSGYVSVDYSQGDTRVYVTALGRQKTVTIPVRVDDGYGGSDAQDVLVYITCGDDSNDPPEFYKEVQPQRISCDDSFADFNLYARDPEGDSITYDYAGQGDFDVSISGSRVSIDNPGYNYKRKITFIATARGGTDTSSAYFEVYGCEDDHDDAEIDLSGVPDQIVCEGDRFDDFDLEDYVDADDDDLDYSFSGEDDLDVDLDGSEVSVDYPRGFLDREYITFKVKDSKGNTDTEKVSFEVEECDDYHPGGYPMDVFVPTIRFVEFKPTPEPFTMCTAYDRLTRKTLPDADCDKLPDDRDNCPTVANPTQKDQNTNGIGDACDLSITSFDITPKDVSQGQSFTVSAGIRNKMDVDLARVRVVVDVEELGLHETKDVGPLLSGESDQIDMSMDVPECSKAKKYVVKFNVEYLDHDSLYTSGPVTVVEGACHAESGNLNIVDVYNVQDIPPGGTAVYPLKIANADPYAKSYTVRMVGVDGWGTYWFDTGSVVIVPAYSERTVNAYVAANQGVAAGEKTFMAEFAHANEVRQVVLVASVKGTAEGRYPLMISILQVILVLLVLAVLVIAVVALVARKHVQSTDPVAHYY